MRPYGRYMVAEVNKLYSIIISPAMSVEDIEKQAWFTDGHPDTFVVPKVGLTKTEIKNHIRRKHRICPRCRANTAKERRGSMLTCECCGLGHIIHPKDRQIVEYMYIVGSHIVSCGKGTTTVIEKTTHKYVGSIPGEHLRLFESNLQKYLLLL